MNRSAVILAVAVLFGATQADAFQLPWKRKPAQKPAIAAPAQNGRGANASVSAQPAAGQKDATSKKQQVVQPAAVQKTVTSSKSETAKEPVEQPIAPSKSAAPAAGATPASDETAVSTPAAGKGEDTAPFFGDDAELPASLRENNYFYQSFGTADPFRSLLAGDFEPKQQVLVDLYTVKLVGVVWETDEIAAMLQDAQGFGYTLRPGDTVKNGSVVSVTQETLVARLNIFGQTTQLTLRLQHEE